ncbi:hypothetical protein C2S52_007662 [Perilla frutescens var. hirtella]|nr:hypothetical protein C2S52_007662 [Perilla frutescens var. hirtella]
MSEPNETIENQSQTTGNIPDELTLQLATLLQNSLGLQQTQTTQNTESLNIGFKLSGDNYPLWVVLMKKAIGGRGKSLYITGDPAPPPISDPTYKRWEQDDQCVFTWLVQNMVPHLINTVSKHPTSKAVFDLHRKANTIQQEEGTLEEIWAKLQEIWMTIDKKEPNPMECPKDIETYNRIVQTQRVYQFLMALNDKYEPVKKEVLKRESLPSVETMYGMIRRETARDRILRPAVTGDDTSSGIGLSLAARDKSHKGHKDKWACLTEEDKSKMWDDTKKRKLPNHARNRGGSVAATVTADRATDAGVSNTGATTGGTKLGIAEVNSSAAARVPNEEGSNKGGVFRFGPSVVGNNFRHPTTNRTYGNSKRSPIFCTNQFQVLEDFPAACTVPNLGTEKNRQWIFDCGATDTMTFDSSDIVKHTTPRKSHVQTANGELAPVKGAGTIKLSPTLQLSNCVFVPTMSHKLLSISHVTRELNCTLLMQPHFYLLHDIRTGEIIGRGTERCGLYYVDEIAPKGVAMLTHRPVQSTVLGDHTSETSSPLLIPEVQTSNDSSDSSSFLDTNTDGLEEVICDEEIGNEAILESGSTEMSTEARRYVLPPRSNRGVPPKRYSPEHTGRRTRYPVEDCATSHLTKTAQAFEAALLREEDEPRKIRSQN